MQSITIEIDAHSKVRLIEGTSKAGRGYSFRTQSCVVHGAGRFPREGEVRVPDGAQPFVVGLYEVHDLISVSDRGRFEINNDYFLTAVAKSAKAVA